MRASPILALAVLACAASARALAQGECVGFVELTVASGGTNGLEALATADLDGDGDVDLVTASYGDGHVLWHENVGGGSFVEHVISDDEPGASDVFVIDLDEDGALDVLTTARTSGRVSWFRGHRDPGAPPVYSEHVITSLADVPLAVFAADVDGDGDLDVLSAGFNDDKIVWYENGGGDIGVFPSRDISTTADGAADVAAADLDGDGDVDVVSAARLSGLITWYENDGAADPAFTAHDIASAPGATSVALADIDGDGDIDIAASSLGDHTVYLYLNINLGPPGPSFPGQVVSTAGLDPVRVVVADVDGDGKRDLLSAGRQSDTILWHRNLGGTPPTFDTIPISTDTVSAQSVAAADLDGDGDTDVVSTASVPGFPATGDELAWYENQGTTTFPTHAIFGGADGARAVAGADLDGDGDTDVATAGRPDKIAWQRNVGGPGPQFEEQPISSLPGASLILAVDFDGDTDVDLVSAGTDGGVVAWQENNGSGVFTQHTISSVEPDVSSIDVADIDGDGDLDVLTALFSADTVAWLESDGGTPPSFTRHVVVDDVDGAISVDAGDIDGDGDTDVVVASSQDDTVAWFESDGATPPTFTRHDVTTTATLADGASAVLLVDLDDDGDLDIVAGSAEDNVLAWFTNDGAAPPSFTRHLISVIAAGVTSIVAADFDGDGDLDLATANAGNGSIFWYESDGAATPALTPILVSVTADQVRSIAVADVNGDGLPDLLAGERLTVSWFRSTHEICQNFDASGDGRIDGVELSWLGRAFGSFSSNPSAEWWAGVDFDGSGTIDGDDLSLLVTPGVFGFAPDECELICVP
jgi:hypothetical protein